MLKYVIKYAVVYLFIFAVPPALAQDSAVERYIIKYRAGSKISVASQILESNGEIKLAVDNHRLFAAELSPSDKERLIASDEIEFIEIDPKRYLMNESTPYGIPIVEADQVNETMLTPRKVCIIDTGFDISHPDLQAARVTGDNQVQFTTINNVVYYTINNGPWQNDVNGHGTKMGGIIAALGNTIGVRGVNPGDNLYLHIVKTFSSPNPNLPTLSFWTYGSRTIHALDQCLAAGANIVNMSYGGSNFSQAENQALIAAYNSNVLLVGAAGNSGTSDPKYPASLDAVISVGAVDSLETVASISQHHSTTELSAPGVAVNSTTVNHGYAMGTGTSGAAAYVTGVAALVWGNHPSCTNQDIRHALANTAEDKGAPGKDNYYGHGIVKAKQAHEALTFAGSSCIVPAQAPQLQNGGVVTSLIAAAGTQLNFTMNVSSSATNSNTSQASLAKSMSAPAGLTDLSFVLSGGTGDADLYVKYGAKPTIDEYDCRSNGSSSDENCFFPTPQEGKYYIMVQANSLFYGVSLVGSYTDGSSLPLNAEPIAGFTFSCEDLVCRFDGRDSSDSDGVIETYDWNMGDGQTKAGIGTLHSFSSAGTYDVTLTVTDDGGAINTITQTVDVTQVATPQIDLVVRTRLRKKKKISILTWSGATTRKVDLYVDGVFARRIKNNGHIVHRTRRKANPVTYQICNRKSTTVCSDVVTD